MNLAGIITKVLSNSQIDLVLTEDGFDWLPKNFTGSIQFLSIIDQDGLIAAWHAPGEPNAEDLAEWVWENTSQWIEVSLETEEDEREPNEERIAFLLRLLENF